MKKCISLLLAFFISFIALAQEGHEVEMADAFRSEGKIYIVVAVILTILIGLFLYLIRIDRKLHRLENDKNLSA